VSARVVRAIAFALAIAVGACAGIAAAAEPKLLTLADLRKVVTVAEPQIAPDGTRVVYARSRIDWAGDRINRELVLVDSSGDNTRVLTHGRFNVHSPRWSPDGRRIAYLAGAAERGPSQIYVLPMDGGDSLAITRAKTSVLSFAWRPDSGALAFVTEDEAANKTAIAHHLDAVTITDNDYLTREAPLSAHVWLVDRDGRHATRLTSGTWSVVKDAAPVWMPDGSRILFQRQPDPIFAHFVSQTTYAYDVATKHETDLGFGIEEDPRPSPDGSELAYLAPRHRTLYLQRDVNVRRFSGGDVTFSSIHLDRNAHAFRWIDNSTFAVVTADGVRSVLSVVSALSGRGFEHIDLGDLDVAPDFTIAPGSAIAFVGLRRDRPPEIYFLAAGSKTPKKLSDDNAWIGAYAMPRIEEFEWQTDMGQKADGVLIYPNGYVAGKKYPLVLDVHGGPVSTSTWDFSGLEGGGLVQVLAAHGYFVLRPNYRGSDGLGDAYLQAIVGDVTSGPGRDNLAAVDALRKTGMIDESRIGVSGWSGGGLQTSWLIGHADFWRAAVMGAAVTDWYQQALLADINENFAAVFFAGVKPFGKEGRAKYAAESPITFAGNVKTPTLILSDTRDQRVPVSQAYTFYHALSARHVPVKFVAFPRAGHFPTDPVGREQVLDAWVGWFDRWMK
jgi:dipeptidyl aminopeptidase/acylaminoacyl peptidase